MAPRAWQCGAWHRLPQRAALGRAGDSAHLREGLALCSAWLGTGVHGRATGRPGLRGGAATRHRRQAAS